MMPAAVPPPHVVIVGGGAAGALFAVALARAAPGGLAVTVLEPRERLGAGLAYSTPEPRHVINVPAARMSADPSDPAHFIAWLERHGVALDPDAPYPPRRLVGLYAADHLDAALRAQPGVALHHRRTGAAAVRRHGTGWQVVTRDGEALHADAVALATGNPSPLLPGPLAEHRDHPALVADPWAPGALDAVDPEASVLLVGTGLTMGDMLASLDGRGHRGPLLALSRRGLLPRRGLPHAIEPVGDFASPRFPTALALLRGFRAEVARAAVEGRSWHAVLLAARLEGWALWGRLPVPERARFVRHLRVYYEVHRHVMAGPVHDLVTGLERAGRLRVAAGRLDGVRAGPAGFEVDWRPRGASRAERTRFDAIVTCTGPSYGALAHADPLWSGLADAGLVTVGAEGMGPVTDPLSRLVGRGGRPEPGLVALGTLARGAFGELTGLREIERQTREAAGHLLAALSGRSDHSPGRPAREVVRA